MTLPKQRPPSALDHLFDGCTGETISVLPDGRTQAVSYTADPKCYGLKPVPIKTQ